MKQFVLLLTLLLGAAAPPRDNVRYYAIFADGGRMIGHATHEERWGREGPELVDRSEVELQELDQPPLRMTSETVARRDRAGRTVWLSEYSQTGTGWARTEARIADGRAEISHRTRIGTVDDRHPAAGRCALRRRPRAAQELGPAGARRGSNSRTSTSARWRWTGW